MTPPSDAPSRRSVSALALWSAPVVALAVAAPAASASGPTALAAEQPGWNVSARSGRGISSGGLTGYTGFAFQETAGLVPAPVVSFVETVLVVVTAHWAGPADAQAARDAAAVTAQALMTAVLVPPARRTPGVGVGTWSVVGPMDKGETIFFGSSSPDASWDSGYAQFIEWRAERTIDVADLGASGQAGYSVVADYERPNPSPITSTTAPTSAPTVAGKGFTSFDTSLAAVAGSGAVTGDDSPGLEGVVTLAARAPGPVSTSTPTPITQVGPYTPQFGSTSTPAPTGPALAPR